MISNCISKMLNFCLLSFQNPTLCIILFLAAAMAEDSMETFPPYVPEWYHLSSAQERTCLDCVRGNLFYDRIPVFVIRVNADGTSPRGTCVNQIDLEGVTGSYYGSYACDPLMCQEPKVIGAMLAETIDCNNGKATWI
jgi:hypothetical protein